MPPFSDGAEIDKGQDFRYAILIDINVVELKQRNYMTKIMPWVLKRCLMKPGSASWICFPAGRCPPGIF